MKKYVKPEVAVLSDANEGIFAASGSETGSVKCRFGREEASAGSDVCQSCCKTNGMLATAQAYRSDYTSCIDQMPEKNS